MLSFVVAVLYVRIGKLCVCVCLWPLPLVYFSAKNQF